MDYLKNCQSVLWCFFNFSVYYLSPKFSFNSVLHHFPNCMPCTCLVTASYPLYLSHTWCMSYMRQVQWVRCGYKAGTRGVKQVQKNQQQSYAKMPHLWNFFAECVGNNFSRLVKNRSYLNYEIPWERAFDSTWHGGYSSAKIYLYKTPRLSNTKKLVTWFLFAALCEVHNNIDILAFQRHSSPNTD